MFTIRTIASLAVVAVSTALPACASDDSDRTASEATTDPPPEATEPADTARTPTTVASPTSDTGAPTTDPAVDTTGAPASSVPPATAAPTTAPPDETLCVEPPELVFPAPVEPDALTLTFGTDPAPGRYRSEQLGVALAFDVADAFADVVQPSEAIMFVGEFDEVTGSLPSLAIARPSTYLAGPADVEPQPVDLDTWLAETGVEVLSDAPGELAGLSSRELVFRIPGEPLEPGEISEEENSVRLLGGLAPTPSGDATEQLFVVDIGDATPLVIWRHDPVGDTTFDTAAQSLLEGLAIGEHETAPDIVLADTPWNRNWFEQTVVGPCILPAIAFGGIEIGLSQPTLVAGEGDELHFAPTSEEFSGFSFPRVFVQRPTAAADGTAVNDAAGVIAAYSAAAYELTELDDAGVTLFGAPARSFEFTNSDGIGFRAGDHDASTGTDLSAIFSSGRTGVFHVADTVLGPILVQMDAELGTDDLAMVEPIVADVLSSIS